MVGKLILVQARADSTAGSFVLDTGAPDLVLNPTYFRGYTPIEASDENQMSVVGQGGAVQKITIQTLALGSFKYANAEASLVNLSAIENLRGVKILGLLGLALFKDCEVIIDYSKRLIYLHYINKKEAKTYAHPMLAQPDRYDAYSFDIRESRMVLSTAIADKKLNFVIDCAAENNLIDSRLPDRVMDSISISGRVVITGAGTNSIEAFSGTLAQLSVGTQQLKNLPIIVTNLEKTCFGTLQCADGVLGYDFLARSVVAFNFVKQKIYIFK
ncbi:MAG: hypothetical protein EAY75_07095 [Bacteroidetes bacterium]|nr:MAG: hypothetical protein EAY75_07095 [Bacteroidota bacterium]